MTGGSSTLSESSWYPWWEWEDTGAVGSETYGLLEIAGGTFGCASSSEGAKLGIDGVNGSLGVLNVRG
jgi:hypothetical protein